MSNETNSKATETASTIRRHAVRAALQALPVGAEATADDIAIATGYDVRSVAIVLNALCAGSTPKARAATANFAIGGKFPTYYSPVRA